jgi:hypothetical protein
MAYPNINHNGNSELFSISKLFIAIWILLLMAMYIRVSINGAGNYYFSIDELFHINIAKGKTFKEVLQFSLYETHPPLGHIIRHYWIQISQEPIFIRSLSLVFGVLLIPLYYLIGKILNGPLTGMCAAALVAYSHGFIMQSFMVRNYSILLFLGSLGFYYYLRWQKDFKNSTLLGYCFWILLACFTHFSGSLILGSIAIYETIRLFQNKSEKSKQIKWVLANGIVGLIAILSYYPWHNILEAVHQSQIIFPSSSPVNALFYFVVVFSYLFFPSTVNAGYIFICIATLIIITYYVMIVITYHIAKSNKVLRSQLMLLGIAFLIGMILFASGTYQSFSRRSLWMAPFIISPIAITFADCCMLLSARLNKIRHAPWLHYMSIIVLAGGAIPYNPAEVYGDPNEKVITKQEWQKLTDYLSVLDSASLIVSERDNLGFLGSEKENPYSYYYHYKELDLVPEASVMPYHSTQILFDSHNRRWLDSNIVPALIQEAYDQGKLDHVDSLVFLNNSWAFPALVNLVFCPDLNKKIVTWPELQQGHDLTPKDVLNLSFVLLIVSKQDFVNQLLAPNGKARHCLFKAPYTKIKRNE